MIFRDHYLKREATINDSDLVVIDLNMNKPVSALIIEYEATNGATSCLNKEIHDDVSKIEVVDGSDVLFSLSMIEALGLNYLELGRIPHHKLTEAAAAVQEESVIIHFGRMMDDPRFYLDPTKFSNLQLRLTHALTISATAGFATGTGKITVKARIIEEGAEAQEGFMMSKLIKNYTSGTSGEEQTDLPRDFPYRLLGIKALKTLLRPDEVISKNKLSLDADARIPFENFMEDTMDANEARHGEQKQIKELFSADDGTALLDLYDIRHADARTTEDDHIAHIEGVDAEQVTNSLYDLTTPGTPALQGTAKAVIVSAYGGSPHAMNGEYFGDPMNPGHWLDSRSFGDIKLIQTQVAAGNVSIILQQARS